MKAASAGTLAALLATLLAGCGDPGDGPATTSSTQPAPVLDLAFLTPGEWVVRGDTDHMLAWIRNRSPFVAQAVWSLTGPAGSPLPAAWNASFDRTTALLEPAGTIFQTESGERLYPDWDRVLVTLRIPPGTPAGDHYVELRAGPHAVHSARLIVGEARGRVGAPGDHANVDLRGSFHANGTRFWITSFGLDLADPTIPAGIAFAAVGAAPGETVRAVAPPPLAYGYDQPAWRPDGQPNDLARFNGQTLVFEVTLKSLS